MVQAYVKVTDGGYVTEWSLSRQDGFQQVETEEALISNIDAVQVVGGVAILDKEKQAKVIQEAERPSDFDLMKQQNAALMMQLAEQSQVVEQLQQMNAQSALSQAELDERLKTVEGVERNELS
ncbi:hypothetical protein [Listeria sp. ILCC792]|uniref:hypothetical protein n=1 Tax=Listeria sp. ILCC792 TaxID=1918331 RepID=UPI000B597E3A|nr:hypothetical protein [Listeria sp. ILCC792]